MHKGESLFLMPPGEIHLSLTEGITSLTSGKSGKIWEAF